MFNTKEATNKYNIKDTVWRIEYGKAVEKIVYGIVLLAAQKDPTFIYCLEKKDDIATYGWQNEDSLFPTKEALIASL